MTVGELLGGGYRIIANHLKTVLIWTAIQLILGFILFKTFVPLVGSMQAAQLASAEAAGLPPGFGLILLIELGVLIWLLALFAAVVRMAGSSGGDRFAWLRLGMDEVRLIGLGILYIIGAIIFGIVVSLVFGLITGLSMMISFTLGTIMTFVLALCLLALTMWLSVRLSLIAPLTVLDGELAIRKGWRATKGRFWTLFLAYLVMIVAYVVVEIVLVAIFAPGLFSLSMGQGDPQQVIENQQRMMETMSNMSVGTIVMWLAGTVIGTFGLTYYYGVVATAAIMATGHSGKDLEELGTQFE